MFIPNTLFLMQKEPHRTLKREIILKENGKMTLKNKKKSKQNNIWKKWILRIF